MKYSAISTKQSFQHTVISVILSVLMSILFYKARLIDPSFSPTVGSLIRVISAVLFIPILLRNDSFQSFPKITSDFLLYLWGILGALTVFSFFQAINNSGPAKAQLLASTSGIFLFFLGPIFGTSQFSLKKLLIILISLLGLYLSLNTESSISFSSDLWGLASGLFSGLAYLTISKMRGKYGHGKIMTSWFIFALLFHILLVSEKDALWPTNVSAWFVLILAGLAASGAQYFLTKAYTKGNILQVTQITYVIPLITLLMEFILFDRQVSSTEVFGSGLVVFSCILMRVV